jgi:hypothetical protein
METLLLFDLVGNEYDDDLVLAIVRQGLSNQFRDLLDIAIDGERKR